MSYIDTFKLEREERELYGVSTTHRAEKVLILSYLLLRSTDLAVRQKLLSLYSKYNRGSGIIINVGGGSGTVPGGPQAFIEETYSRTISIARQSLSGVGTFEEQIVEFINNGNKEKLGTDAEVWIEVDE